ncbi:hypothetical protein NGM10_01080 [Halorussus salilacus]|uniref:hypothetical protein n=1 Tax=Halorussus salilacus TaxID=2953750 RepID=UPI0020A15693|nr:hypothetical protein [Halorussus salilacus]USZ68348.1 hypothetical protein NGM10_01080 [Halorussus salilacus]
MPTFVEAIQSVESVPEFSRRLSDRVETVGEAVDALEAWIRESRATHEDLLAEYEAVKSHARDEIRRETDESVEDVPAEELLDHPAVSEATKERLGESGTKLFAYLDAADSYGDARAELLGGLTAELELYEDLLSGVSAGETSVAEAKQRIARFARTDAVGPANRTAADVILESTDGGE